MATINRVWHEKHRMPKNPTINQRVKWHTEHLKNCSCRKPPANIQALLQK